MLQNKSFLLLLLFSKTGAPVDLVATLSCGELPQQPDARE